MDSRYTIKLNFLPIKGKLSPFRVFRKSRTDGEAKPDADSLGCSLPLTDDSNDRGAFWVHFAETEGFEEFTVKFDDNVHLTRRALFYSFRHSVESILQPADYEIPRDGFFEELSFNFAEYDEGHEQLTIQPYYLRQKRSFGWLVDFRFRVRKGVPFSRRIQQLSLSLDRNFKRNLDCYTDRRHKINSFLGQRRHVFDTIVLPGTSEALEVAKDFVALPARRLRSKVYLFGGNHDSRSQFSGLQQFGPLAPLERPPTLLFGFRECDRQAARTLAAALKGPKTQGRYSFPGFEALFRSPISFDANPIILADLSQSSFEEALQRVKRDGETEPSTIPVFVLPDGDDNGYMQHKAVFAHEGIPTQVCTLRIINDNYALKWAIANIALQMFCKGGGQPWKVRPTADRTLIIGISQSHKLRKEGTRTSVEKYFAFSVLSDNSGLFQQLRVLGDSDNESAYLRELKQNLQQILSDRSPDFSQVVIHTSFRLKRKEMMAIEQTVRDAATGANQKGCRFAVVKVNHRNRFFGINADVNSLVPFEGTAVNLGGGEHLVWFEGIFPDKQVVTKAFPGPTHVVFLRVSEEDAIADESLLQDLVNLSGANWRGFNAKSAPVSVFYCHLVADLVHDFQERGLPLPRVQDLRPWFL